MVKTGFVIVNMCVFTFIYAKIKATNEAKRNEYVSIVENRVIYLPNIKLPQQWQVGRGLPHPGWLT